MSDFDETSGHLLTDTAEGGLYAALRIVRERCKVEVLGECRGALIECADEIAKMIGTRQTLRLKETARAAGRSRRITSDDPDLVERVLASLRERGVDEFDLHLLGARKAEVIVKHGRDIAALDAAIQGAQGKHDR
jgi:hypothetical protein